MALLPWHPNRALPTVLVLPILPITRPSIPGRTVWLTRSRSLRSPSLPVQGLLGNACYVKRYVLPVAMLVGFVLFPTTLANVPFVATVCDIVAFKLGAELMLKNHAKETRMVKVDVAADE